MNFRAHEIILSVVCGLSQRGSWSGKTHVIKTLYLLKAIGNMDMPFQFILYKHGPYSFDVENELALMRSYKAIEGEISIQGYGESLRPGMNKDFPGKFSPIKDKEKEIIDKICNFTAKKDVRDLERLATTAWIVKEEEKKDPTIVSSRLHELKPHISLESAKEAFDELQRIVRLLSDMEKQEISL